MGLMLNGLSVELEPNAPVATIFMHPETAAWLLAHFPMQMTFASERSTENQTPLSNGEN